MIPTLRRSLVVLLLSLLPSAAQDAEASRGAESKPAAALGVIATVNGTAITLTDVTHRVRELASARDMRGVPESEIAVEARRMLAEEILLAAEAVRRGLNMTERQVTDYWTRRLGQRPDFDEIAQVTGTTVQRQKELARRAALAEQFIELRTSPTLLQGSPVTPDPKLVRLMTVTPKQLRTEFKTNRERYDLPDRVVIAAYICRDASSATSVRSSIIEGTPPTFGAQVQREMHPVGDLERAFSPEMATFLRSAPAGAVSQVFPLEVNAVFFVVEEKLSATKADFAEMQAMLRAQLEMNRRREARRILVSQLKSEAAYWPGDILDTPR